MATIPAAGGHESTKRGVIGYRYDTSRERSAVPTWPVLYHFKYSDLELSSPPH